MTTRERWIIYPLLFLALGTALRNQLLPTRRFGAVDLRAGEISAQKIICKEIAVIDTAECNELKAGRFQFNEAFGKHLVTTGLTESPQIKAGKMECQAMIVTDAESKPMIIAGTDKNTSSGVIQTRNSNGVPQVQIQTTDSGGLVSTFGRGGKVRVALGHEEQNFGVFGQFPAGPPFLLTPQVNAKTAISKPSSAISPVNTPQQTSPTNQSDDQQKNSPSN